LKFLKSDQLLFLWLLRGVFLEAWGRWLLALIMVAVGVMLAVSIHTVNHSALAFFGQALDTVNGQASAQLVAPLGEMDDRQIDVWELRKRQLGLVAISPVLMIPTDRLTILGLDFFKAALVSSSLLPKATQKMDDLFDEKSLFLSAPALQALGVKLGDSVILQYGELKVSLTIKGELPGVSSQAIGVMDIGSAQWAFNRLGVVSRLDLRLEDWQTVDGLRASLQNLPDQLQLVTTKDRDRRMSSLSRAYRVNLSVLAMVALLTGGFLVSTAVNLSIIRQRAELALLGTLGASVNWLRRFVLTQGGLIGLIGGILGVALGLVLAAVLMQWLGGDLGGSYFSKNSPPLEIDGWVMLFFVFCALSLGLVSSVLPLLQINWNRPMVVLKGEPVEHLVLKPHSLKWSGLALLISMVLLFLPSMDELPWAGYGSIAFLLCAGLLSLPWLLSELSGGLSFMIEDRDASPVLRLAVWRLSQASSASTPLITGTVAALSLTIAMMIMVSSFRNSVSNWLITVLPADVYTMGPSQSDSPSFSALEPGLIESLPQVQRVESSRLRGLRLANDRPEVMLMAKPINLNKPSNSLALIGQLVLPPVDGEHKVLVFGSEAMGDLYGWSPGSEAFLPFSTGGPQKVWVAGLFRDYGRQHGSVVMSLPDYERLTDDHTRTHISVWLTEGADAAQTIQSIQSKLPQLSYLKWVSASDIRALSLQIFDRSFAMTYVLEAVALLVALFSVATGVTGQLIVRRREFGVLAHLGLSPSQSWALVAMEVGFLLLVAIFWATLLGGMIGEILIQKINPQSFHWTMETYIEIEQWAMVSLLLLFVGVLTSRWAARQGLEPKRLAQSLRADW